MSSEEEKIAKLEKELRSVQEMLAFVLASVGEPVVVTHEQVKSGLPANLQIALDDDLAKEAFVFRLVEVQ